MGSQLFIPFNKRRFITARQEQFARTLLTVRTHLAADGLTTKIMYTHIGRKKTDSLNKLHESLSASPRTAQSYHFSSLHSTRKICPAGPMDYSLYYSNIYYRRGPVSNSSPSKQLNNENLDQN